LANFDISESLLRQLSHLVLGARAVALAHRMPQQKADYLAKVGICLAALVAIAIMVGLSGLRFAA
jgi:hypothetical protein